MSGTPQLLLVLPADLDPRVRARIDYTFRLYCAFQGVSVLETKPTSSSQAEAQPIRLCYGVPADGPRRVELSALYRARPLSEPAAAPQSFRSSDIHPEGTPGEFPCFHGVDERLGPDWLGEAFEWLSCADERAITNQDAIGRIPFEDSLAGRNRLDPCVPYATLAFEALTARIRETVGDSYPMRPSPPWPDGARFAVAPSHDLDFLPVRTSWRWARYAKNLLNAATRRDPQLVGWLLSDLAMSVRDGVPIQFGLEVLREGEERLGIRSSCLVIPAWHHRRDAWYRIQDKRVQTILKGLRDRGCEVGVHGSYLSLDEDGRLSNEFESLEDAGFSAVGGRQHFLRYRWFDRLFTELVKADARYDSSLAFSGQLGFRSGASFPYPPYNFDEESTYPLIEIPLAIMDASLYKTGLAEHNWVEQAQALLQTCRDHGWGGVSILWHNNVFGGGTYPRELVDTYWQLKREDEPWIPLGDVAKTLWPRFQAAGLLPAKPDITNDH